MKNSKNLLMILIVFLVIAIIAFILYIKENGNEDEQVMSCIAEKAKLFVSKTCSHCAMQKQILGEYLELFDTIDCIDNPKECQLNSITSVPTWIINGENYLGVKSISQLKQLTSC